MIDIGYILAGTASVTVSVVLGIVARRAVRTLDHQRDARKDHR